MTVSRVVNGEKNVCETTRDAILKAIEMLFAKIRSKRAGKQDIRQDQSLDHIFVHRGSDGPPGLI
jgi:Bacterial regulatory proteins, lacI family